MRKASDSLFGNELKFWVYQEKEGEATLFWKKKSEFLGVKTDAVMEKGVPLEKADPI